MGMFPHRDDPEQPRRWPARWFYGCGNPIVRFAHKIAESGAFPRSERGIGQITLLSPDPAYNDPELAKLIIAPPWVDIINDNSLSENQQAHLTNLCRAFFAGGGDAVEFRRGTDVIGRIWRDGTVQCMD